MCGVAGAFYARASDLTPVVTWINDQQQHRGPDEAVLEVGEWFVLGHTRLSINALGKEGRQPLFSSDGRWAVVFNGEIYNHVELREAHDLHGIGTSDGAVIPELLGIYGPEGLIQLRGMYAVVAVDTWTREVLVANDPFGIKSLHWTYTSGRLVIGSEPRSLLRLVKSADVDKQAIASFLHRGALDKDQSGLRDIRRLPPGTWVRLNETGTKSTGSTVPNLWVGEGVQDWSSAAESFAQSVSRHLLSEVPLALLLSDGVDSTALAVELSRQDADVTAVTVDLGGGRSEAVAASRTAEELGLSYAVVRHEPSGEDFKDLFSGMQRPTIDGLNTLVVMSALREAGFRVALSGLGGDELLSGYADLRAYKTGRLLRWLPRSLGATGLTLAAKPLSYREAYARLEGTGGRGLPATPREYVALFRQVWPMSSVRDALGITPRPWASSRVGEMLTGTGVANDFSASQIDGYMTTQLLPDGDSYSMLRSVELRVPFVDVEFMRRVIAVPRRTASKAPFVAAMRSPLIQAGLDRPKQGFSLPMADWIRCGPLTPVVDALESRSAPIHDVLSPSFTRGVRDASTQGQEHWSRVWSLAVLNEWLGRVADV